MEKTRSLANLIQSARAFQESRVLLTALELDVFSTVGEGGATAADVAQRLGTEPRATEMLLNALVALGALLKRDTIFRCTASRRRWGLRGQACCTRFICGTRGPLSPNA